MVLLRSSLLRFSSVRDSSRLCSRCLFRLPPQRIPARRSFLSSRPVTDDQSSSATLHKSYFSANQAVDGSASKDGVLASLSAANSANSNAIPRTPSPDPTKISESIAAQTTQELPHRRRKRLKQEAASKTGEAVIPPDASAQLSSIASGLPATSIRGKLAAFLALTKPRLSFLIVLTTTSAYGVYPISSLLALDPSMTPLPTLSTSTLTLLYLTAGTFLTSGCANSLNMLFEPKYDAQMSRTRNRPLVRGLLTRRAALLFAIASAATGLSLLYIGTNPTVTALAAGNIVLYSFIYTWLKRVHVINTWVGAIVGGIPPLMGWVAAAGQVATTGHDTWRDMLFSEDSIGGWLLGALLFAWQFPHFNALSYAVREEYKRAGYKMLCWKNPARNARVALRYSILMFPLSIGLWWFDIVGNGFLIGSSIANGWLVKRAYLFWKHGGAMGSARGLFWASNWQLSILLVGALVTKKGLWDGVWRNVFGVGSEDEVEYIYEEVDEDEEVTTRDSRVGGYDRSSV